MMEKIFPQSERRVLKPDVPRALGDTKRNDDGPAPQIRWKTRRARWLDRAEQRALLLFRDEIGASSPASTIEGRDCLAQLASPQRARGVRRSRPQYQQCGAAL